MIKINTSRHMNMASHTITIGRLRINITNRPQLFEERKLPKAWGWWIKISSCKQAAQLAQKTGVHYG